ncbi:MAG: hypothetical protein ACRDWD_14295 [Acidimicrobiia bacterium]
MTLYRYRLVAWSRRHVFIISAAAGIAAGVLAAAIAGNGLYGTLDGSRSAASASTIAESAGLGVDGRPGREANPARATIPAAPPVGPPASAPPNPRPRAPVPVAASSSQPVTLPALPTASVPTVIPLDDATEDVNELVADVQGLVDEVPSLPRLG